MGLDTATLKTCSRLYTKHDAKGFSMDVTDSIITASALVHRLTVFTRISDGREDRQFVDGVNTSLDA